MISKPAPTKKPAPKEKAPVSDSEESEEVGSENSVESETGNSDSGSDTEFVKASGKLSLKKKAVPKLSKEEKLELAKKAFREQKTILGKEITEEMRIQYKLNYISPRLRLVSNIKGKYSVVVRGGYHTEWCPDHDGQPISRKLWNRCSGASRKDYDCDDLPAQVVAALRKVVDVVKGKGTEPKKGVWYKTESVEVYFPVDLIRRLLKWSEKVE